MSRERPLTTIKMPDFGDAESETGDCLLDDEDAPPGVPERMDEDETEIQSWPKDDGPFAGGGQRPPEDSISLGFGSVVERVFFGSAPISAGST
ncbi:hypothetical protein L249_8648 [Ophiocordyceps polyrhachis-furcata BCC 54312]|uniref:Uncharacterized protein n=1 Tax=Ophiocordyceps polyrhachis-furcata BCC 54312 TaxID=1330021 RepID=A0A367L7S2_9HYPO|nr:hypothetical protein L249_8648 [Ophiocordyceps polyrhachis-furcata BCC 54312]